MAEDAQILIGEAQMAQFGFGSVNEVTLIGNLGRDPEIRHNQSGEKIANLNVATSKSWKDKNSGERKEKVEWHRVVIFDKNIADLIERFCKKGTKVLIKGALATRKWTDQSGAEKFVTEIVLSQYEGTLEVLSDPKSKPESEASNDQSGWEAPWDLDNERPF